ncbi:MAG: YIP1 family protein [Spirochaetes bacterium]|nr:YIP1 family protein [Spirochaetota bacterium]
MELKKLIDISKQVIVSPKQYFSALKENPSRKETIMISVLYGLVAGIINFIYSLLPAEAFARFIEIQAGFLTIILTPLIALLSLYLGSIFILLLSFLLKGKRDFLMILRMVASFQVMMPIYSFLRITYALDGSLGMILEMMAFLYVLWLVYNAFLYTVGVKKIGAIIIVAIIGIFKITSALFPPEETADYIMIDRLTLPKQKDSKEEGFQKAKEIYKGILDKYSEESR